jgi:hypothetical protein
LEATVERGMFEDALKLLPNDIIENMMREATEILFHAHLAHTSEKV